MSPTTESSGVTSPSLLVRVQVGSPEAWSQLVGLYAPLIATWCRTCGLRDADSADVMQNVFISVSRHVADFRRNEEREGAFRNWLWTITHSRIVDWRRAAAGRCGVGGSSHLARLNSMIDELADENSASAFDRRNTSEELPEPTTPHDLNQLMRRAMTQIEANVAPKTWQAFWRCVVDGQSTARVADELGVSVASVRQARSRILRQLREQLGDC